MSTSKRTHWEDASLTELCNHIETTHHVFLKADLLFPRAIEIERAWHSQKPRHSLHAPSRDGHGSSGTA